MAFGGEAGDEGFVHHDVFAMRVEVALGEFDGFAYHDAHGDGGDGLGFCQFEGFADEVAVVDKGLVG